MVENAYVSATQLTQVLINAVTGEVRTRQCGSSDEDDGSIISSSGFPVL